MCALKTRLLIVVSSLFLFFLLLTYPSNYSSLLPVFKVTENPTVISQGTYGNTLTIDLTFGREDVQELINNLETPYPQFFISIEWIERSEEIIELMNKKKIPIGLLGKEGITYIEDKGLFDREVERFEKAIGKKPLWFRTIDYEFPYELQKQAWAHEINSLGSSKYWLEEFPKLEKGDIITVPLHQQERVDIKELSKILQTTDFVTIEQNIFELKVKTKSYPN